jgi:hypothetical protein
LVVPTYLGDEAWFASDAFRSLLPDDWPVEFKRLEEVIHPELLRQQVRGRTADRR